MTALNGFGAYSNVPSIVSASGSRRLGLVVGPSRPYTTIGAAVAAAVSEDVIFVAPGEYEELVVIPHSKPNLQIIGLGGRGSVFVAATTDGVAVTNLADDTTLVNIGCEGDGAGGGLVNSGRRLRAHGCKIEGGAIACTLTMGTVAQIAALTHSDGSDCLLEDCEVCWADLGIVLAASDYGAVTQPFIKNTYFHSLPDASIAESGAAADVRFRGLVVDGCTFGPGDEDTHALPTAWILLNGDNANDGVVTRCAFPAALNSGLNLVSTTLLWTGNLHPAGLSTGQPS